ncbi:MAG: hypothetical protein IKQ18_00830, partial [Clostridia bacterium]|nr:hypothetical protein [Clostridia bacterium]
MQRTKKILSILCALCLLITGYSNLLSYAILAGTHTYTLTASDGNTYRITVTYDEASGIPDDAVLQVREITEDKTEKKEEVRDGIVVSGGSETERELSEYEKYVSKSARALGMSEYDLTFFKIFDITLTNAETGEEYQPNKNVKVSIQLLNGSFNGYSNIDVVHIHDDTNTAEVMECAVNEDTLEFETDSFSVYSISTNEVHIIEFRFYITDEDVAETVTDDGFGVVGGASKYRQIPVNTENGEEYFQRIKSGETPVVPQLTDKFGKQFAGWFEGTFKDNDNTLYFGKTAYDFNHIFENTKFNPDENLIVVNLYARYSTFVNIIFHDQYDEATNTDPVMLIRRGELINGSADIKISDVMSIYKGGNNYAFYGWSTVHIKDPTDPDSVPGDEYMKDPDENGCLSITADLHLYPVFKPVHWLSYYSAETGSGATYIPAAAYFEDEGPTKLQVPVWEGHEFKGWYNGILSTNENAGDTVAYSTQITDENGHFLEENMTGNGVVVNNGKLYLTQDTMLFAQWGLETVSYKVIIWKEKTTDTPKTSPKMYDFSDSIKLKTAPNTSESESIVSVADEYKTLEYLTNYGYVFASCSPDVKVDNNGYTVLDVYYDLDPNYTRTPSANPHTLKFVDSMANNNTEYVFAAYNESVAYRTSLLTGNNGGSYVPADPSSPTVGYEGQK